MFFWKRIERGRWLCFRTPGSIVHFVASVKSTSAVVPCRDRWSSRPYTPRPRMKKPKELWSFERKLRAAFWGKDLDEHRWARSTTLPPFLRRAPDATLSTSPTMLMVTWALMPSSKWTPRPATSPRAFWRSEMWLLRLGSASIQVCRVTWEAVSWRGWGLELGAEPGKAKSSSSETTGEDEFASLGREDEALFHPPAHRSLLQHYIPRADEITGRCGL